MAGFIVLQDGRAYAAANWAYDVLIESVSAALRGSGRNAALADWLMAQRSEVQGSGLGHVDLRELTDANRQLLLEIIPQAYQEAKTVRPAAFKNSAYYEGWLDRFADLVKMIACVQKGEPPEQFNPHMKGLLPAKGGHAGPGWD